MDAVTNNNEITEITRRDICDEIRVRRIAWWGRLDELAFLSRVFPDISEYDSYDRRFDNMADEIWQHRVINTDGPFDWVFDDDRLKLLTCQDSVFLKFLCQTIHPVVRELPQQVEALADIYNGYLKHDGWELFVAKKASGSPIFEARRIAGGISIHLDEANLIAEKLGSEYVSMQINRIKWALDQNDPDQAIGSAKEFLETICKAIHDKFGVEIEENIELTKLLKSTRELLELLPENIKEKEKGAKVIKSLLGNLGGVASGMGEVRNLFGTGHGRNPSTTKKSSLELRHAKLATGAAITLAVFFYETYEARHRDKHK